MSWISVPGNSNYEVSESGQIKRLAGTARCRKDRILRPTKLKHTGYLYVTLCADGQKKRVYVHVVVAEAFLGPRGASWREVQVNHKNGVKSDNGIDNLEYLTTHENSLHSARKLGNRQGIKNGMAKLTEDQVREIRDMRPRDAVTKFGIHYQNAFLIKHHKTWAHLP